MGTRTERQHYVPAFYLAQWAMPQERTGRMKVFDRTNGKSWPSTPEGVGFARDFYTIDSREAPQSVEDVLAKIEGIGARDLEAVRLGRRLRSPPDRRGLHRPDAQHERREAARHAARRERVAAAAGRGS